MTPSAKKLLLNSMVQVAALRDEADEAKNTASPPTTGEAKTRSPVGNSLKTEEDRPVPVFASIGLVQYRASFSIGLCSGSRTGRSRGLHGPFDVLTRLIGPAPAEGIDRVF